MMMLYGMGVESLLKALATANGFNFVSHDRNGRPRFNDRTNHDLVKLAKKIGVTLSPAEEELLGRLSNYVRWAGRYPVAKKPLDKLRQKHGYSKELAIRFEDRRILDPLVDRLFEEMQVERDEQGIADVPDSF